MGTVSRTLLAGSTAGITFKGEKMSIYMNIYFMRYQMNRIENLWSDYELVAAANSAVALMKSARISRSKYAAQIFSRCHEIATSAIEVAHLRGETNNGVLSGLGRSRKYADVILNGE